MRNRITRTSSRKSRTSRKSRVKTTLKTGLIKRGVRSTKISRKDVNLNMENIIREDEYGNNEKLTCIANIRNIVQNNIKGKGLTNKDIRKTLGMKKYEK